MDEYEELFRGSLERHADEVDTAVAVPTARKRAGWQLPLAAAAAVVTVAAGVTIWRDGPTSPSVEFPPTETIPADWRVEQWHGVQVSVPPAWGWGGAPVSDGGGRQSDDLLDCGAAAFVRVNGEKIANLSRSIPYVGRPLYMTDMCMSYQDAPPPEAPYVWLGVDLPTGTVDLGQGWSRQTIEVAGQTVTVATDDDTLARQILGSARSAPESDDTCAPQYPGPPEPRVGVEGVSGDPEGMTVCAYQRDGDVVRLVYSTHVGRPAAERFLGPPYGQEPVGCTDVPDEWVVLLIPYADVYGGGRREVARVVLGFGTCSFLQFHPESRGPLLENKVAPWAVGGIPAYVTGPWQYTPELAPYFRGMLG